MNNTPKSIEWRKEWAGDSQYADPIVDSAFELMINLESQITKRETLLFCKVCEFEKGWGKPFCGVCGTIFNAVPILQRIREYVVKLNDDYKEDEERDQIVSMIDALIHLENAGGMARELAAQKPESTTDLNG